MCCHSWRNSSPWWMLFPGATATSEAINWTCMPGHCDNSNGAHCDGPIHKASIYLTPYQSNDNMRLVIYVPTAYPMHYSPIMHINELFNDLSDFFNPSLLSVSISNDDLAEMFPRDTVARQNVPFLQLFHRVRHLFMGISCVTVSWRCVHESRSLPALQAAIANRPECQLRDSLTVL